MNKKPAIFLAQPTYDGKQLAKAQTAVKGEIIAGFIHADDSAQYSALIGNHNNLWCNCLNHKEEYGITHFMMLHNDIVPEMGFAQKMLEIMERTGVDILSTVVPFKSMSGLTSTALEINSNGKLSRRLTLKEIAQLPETFGIKDCKEKITNDATCLLANTGLILINLAFHSVRHLYFDDENWIEKTPEGKFEARLFSEDWFFTRLAQQYGAKLMCTREVKVRHVGETEFDNQGVWGMEHDKFFEEQP